MQSSYRMKAGRIWRKSLPFWLLLPTILVLLLVQVYPSVYTIWLSLRERTPKGGWDYIGFENFERLLNMGVFTESIGHTIVFLVGYSCLTLVAGYLIAQLLKRNVKFSGIYITLMFIPWVLADIVAGMIFRLLVTPDYGYLSGILQNTSLFPPDGVSILTDVRPDAWIGEFPFPPSPSMIYLILASAWRALPFVTLLLLAALQTVPSEVIESARMDGANRLQMSRFITIPLITPALVVALFNLTLSGMNGVGMVFSLTSGGPGTTTQVLSYLLYMIGWSCLRFGQAAALALMLAVVNWMLIFGVLWITRMNQRSR